MAFKQIFRLAFITFIWKQYKAWIISSVILLACIFIISQVHSDLLHVWEMNQNTSHASISLLYKWAAYLICIATYICYNLLRNKELPKDSLKTAKESRKKIEKELSELPQDEDPFNLIRRRSKLRSRSDFLLDKK